MMCAMRTKKPIDQDIENMSALTKTQREMSCKEAYERLKEYFLAHGKKEKDAFAFVKDLFRLCVSADRGVHDEEFALYRDIFDPAMTEKAFFKFTKYGGDPDFVDRMDDFVDSLEESAKKDVCHIALCILCSDGLPSRGEYNLLVRLYED